MPIDERPWWERIPEILLYPASVSGVLATILLGGLGWLAHFVVAYGAVGFGSFAILGLIFSTIFAIIRDSADGSVVFPEIGNYRNAREDVVIPGIKATVLAIVLFLPAIGMMVFGAVSSFEESHPPGAPMAAPVDLGKLGEMLNVHVPATPQSVATPAPEPIVVHPHHSPALAAVVLLSIVAALLYPLCLLILAMSRSLLSAINPIVWGQILAAVGAPAWVGLLAGLFGLGVIGAVLSLPLDLLSEKVPLVFSLASNVVQMWFTLCGAHLLGLFVWQHRDALGHSADVREEMNADRVRKIKEATLAEVSRRGARGPVAGGGITVGAAANRVEPQMPSTSRAVPAAPSDALPPTPDELAGLGARFAAACASRDLAAATATAPALVDAWWQLGNVPSALAVWYALAAADPDASLDPPRQGRIARQLEDSGNALAAAGAWRSLALKFPDHSQTPRALFRCAECYQKGGRVDWAKSALENLLKRYPASEEAAMAKSKLRSFPK